MNVIESVQSRNWIPIATESLEYSTYDNFSLMNSDYVNVIRLRCLSSRSRAKQYVCHEYDRHDKYDGGANPFATYTRDDVDRDLVQNTRINLYRSQWTHTETMLWLYWASISTEIFACSYWSYIIIKHLHLISSNKILQHLKPQSLHRNTRCNQVI